MDMHSGGGQKLQWGIIYIEAPPQSARVIFYNRFGRSPDRVTCICCGEDYSVSDAPTFDELSKHDRGDLSSAEYAERKDVLILKAADIDPLHRVGEVPTEGYVWQ